MNFGPFNLDIALVIALGTAGGVLQSRFRIPLGKAVGWILAVIVGVLGVYFVWDCRDGAPFQTPDSPRKNFLRISE